jgi:hypothetical protein
MRKPVKITCIVNGVLMLENRKCDVTTDPTVASILSDLRRTNYIPRDAALRVRVNRMPVRFAGSHVLRKRDIIHVEAFI